MTDQELAAFEAADKAKFTILTEQYNVVDKAFKTALHDLEVARQDGQISSAQCHAAHEELIDALNRFMAADKLTAIQAVIDKYLPLPFEGSEPSFLERL
jgi:hypothetical protein